MLREEVTQDHPEVNKLVTYLNEAIQGQRKVDSKVDWDRPKGTRHEQVPQKSDDNWATFFTQAYSHAQIPFPILNALTKIGGQVMATGLSTIVHQHATLTLLTEQGESLSCKFIHPLVNGTIWSQDPLTGDHICDVIQAYYDVVYDALASTEMNSGIAYYLHEERKFIFSASEFEQKSQGLGMMPVFDSEQRTKIVFENTHVAPLLKAEMRFRLTPFSADARYPRLQFESSYIARQNCVCLSTFTSWWDVIYPSFLPLACLPASARLQEKERVEIDLNSPKALNMPPSKIRALF